MAVARDRTPHDQSHMGMPGLVHHEEEGALINFKTSASINHGFDGSGNNNSGVSNVLSFEQHKPQVVPQDEYWMWEENLIQPSSSRLSDDFSSCSKDTGALAWLYSDPTIDHCIQDHDTLPQDSSFLHKRPHLGENANMQSMKKQCTSNGTAKNKQKPKERSSSVLASKDPQSIAAKNRRERISERLKVLQELVPNGTKVDLVTMLEKAIGYVKFLQLQVKVLGTDEFWPVQGGKAPDIAQVKEAIDAILSSQRDSRNSSSSSKS